MTAVQQEGEVSGGLGGEAVAFEAHVVGQRVGRFPTVAEGRIGDNGVEARLLGRVLLPHHVPLVEQGVAVEDFKQRAGWVRRAADHVGLKRGLVRRDLSSARRELDVVRQELDVGGPEPSSARQELGVVRRELDVVRQELGSVRQELGVVRRDYGRRWRVGSLVGRRANRFL